MSAVDEEVKDTVALTDDVETADPTYRVTVYQMGVRRARPAPQALTGGVTAAPQPKVYPKLTRGSMEQLFLAHRMRNELVDVENEYELQVADLWRTVPELAEVNTKIIETTQIVEKLVQQASNQAQQRRSKDKIDPALKTELKEQRAALKELRTRQRVLKGEYFPQIQAGLMEIRDNRKALIKEIRQGYAARGLYWATYNRIIDQHATAVKNITQRRKNGQLAAHKFHRWQGEGTLSVQLQRSAADPVRSPRLFAEGTGPWRNVVQFGPYLPPDQWAQLRKADRRKMGQGKLRMRVSGDEHIELPITVSRMFPPEADITGVQLTQRRVGRKAEISVAVTARVPLTPLRTTGPSVAIHPGWRVRDDGSLRVATWVASDVLPTPGKNAFLPGTFSHNGSWGEIIFPNPWREEFAKVDGIRAARDKNLDQIKVVVADYLSKGTPFAVLPDLTPGLAKLIRSPAHIATLTRKLIESRNNCPPDVKFDRALLDITVQLETWCAEDEVLWNREARMRKNLIRRRNDAYRRIAAWLGRTAKVMVVDDMDLAELAKIKDTDDGQQMAKARSNRVLAAPGDLRRFLENASSSHGAKLVKTSSGTNRYTHYVCGVATVAPQEYMQSVTVHCTACDVPYDQDVNMGRLLLATAGEAKVPTPRTAS